MHAQDSCPLAGAASLPGGVSRLVDRLTQQLQLAACVLRSAIRSAAKAAMQELQVH